MIDKVYTSLKNGGLRGLIVSGCHFVIRQLSSKDAKQIEEQTELYPVKMPISQTLNRYRFIEISPFGDEIKADEIDPDSINWFVPNFEKSSGGHLTVFRLIKDLEKFGFKSRIIFESSAKTVEEIRQSIKENFLPLDCSISIGLAAVPPAYFSFATNWTTAYILKNFVSTIEKCYFLQDYEPYFYPPGTDYYLAERTYTFGFRTFTGGNWIAEQLRTRHNVNAEIFPFGCDTSFYVPGRTEERVSGKKRLLFYARPSTPRRGFELAMLAFEKLLNKHADIEVVLAGCDFSAYALPDGIKSVGIVPMSDLPKLYRSCDAALIISFTNVSLLPLDLMASGCAVVSNVGPQVEWLLNEQIAKLTQADPDSLFIALEQILADDRLRLEQVDRAYEFVRQQQWSSVAQLVSTSLRNVQKGCQARQMGAISR